MGALKILSRSEEGFRDRQEAGRLLAQELIGLRGKKAVVLGIPRGGIVVAREIAQELDAEMDIVLSRKLRTPGQEELAMGSVSEDGHVFLNDRVVREIGISKDAIQREKEAQMAEIARRSEMIRKVLPKVSLKGRYVVITDDGVATGATFQAALWSVRHEQPLRLIAAVPVGPNDTLAKLSEDTDELICLRSPPFFAAVGQFYMRFGQVEDGDVLEILREEQKRKTKR